MELLVFGHAGMPVLIFPTSQGKYFEYEDRGMTGVLAARSNPALGHNARDSGAVDMELAGGGPQTDSFHEKYSVSG